MKSEQDLVSAIRAASEKVVDYLSIQAERVVILVSKRPKKPALSWEQIIDECFPAKPHVSHVSSDAPSQKLPEVDQQLAMIPSEMFEELLGRIQMNSLDEIQMIRLYEKLSRSDVLIVHGHVHFYKSSSEKGVETIDYETLKARVLEKFILHKKLTAIHVSH